MTTPDSTDPGAVTHDEARAIISHWAGARTAAKLSRYIHQCESALTAMTARADAAEAERNSWKLEARSLAADVVRCWEHGRLGSRDHAMYNAAKRIKDSSDGAHVARDQTTTPVESATSGTMAEAKDSTGSGGEVSDSHERLCPAGGGPFDTKVCSLPYAHDGDCKFTRTQLSELPPEPAPAGFAVGQRVRDKRDGETGIVLRIDATGVSWRNEKTDLVYISHGDDLEPAPQPAAAPKVLPVEEPKSQCSIGACVLWRGERYEITGTQGHAGNITRVCLVVPEERPSPGWVDVSELSGDEVPLTRHEIVKAFRAESRKEQGQGYANQLLDRVADRLERGGEGKASPKRPDDSDT